MTTTRNKIRIAQKLALYNMRIIFGNRFAYFLLAALGMFLLISGIYIFDAENVSIEDMYEILIVPGVLILFYPTVFGIQNDSDARTLEIIFAIPDYRYKVWLIRLIMAFVLAFLFLVPLAAIQNYAIVDVQVLDMVWKISPLMLFIGAFAFGLSAIVRNGMGTAALLVIIGVALMIVFADNEYNMWNIFLNPYSELSGLNDVLWDEMLLKNRIFLLSSTVVFILIGLYNLQFREKFLG